MKLTTQWEGEDYVSVRDNKFGNWINVGGNGENKQDDEFHACVRVDGWYLQSK